MAAAVVGLRRWSCSIGSRCQVLLLSRTSGGQTGSSRTARSRSMATKISYAAPEKPNFSVATALMMVQKNAREKRRRFTESVEIALQLGVDPRKTNQIVRGVVVLPHGTGKQVRVAVFARGAEAEAATAAGASRVGAEDLLADIQAGKIDFDRLVATPDMMPLIGRVARILGPRGLMPNPKLGTLTKNVAPAVQAAKGGQVEYRAMKDGMVMAGLGKVDFPHAHLMENVRAFMIAISSSKPEAAKGKYMKQAHLSSTMGKGVRVNVATLDPSNGRFMIVTEDEKPLLLKQEAEFAAADVEQAAHKEELDKSEIAYVAARAAARAELEIADAMEHSDSSAAAEQQQFSSAPAA